MIQWNHSKYDCLSILFIDELVLQVDLLDFVASDWKSVGESQHVSEDFWWIDDESAECGFIWGDWCRLIDRIGGDGDDIGVVFDIFVCLLFY